MNEHSQVKRLAKPRILVAPLDWGLGHATRCIPLVKELVKQGAEVWLAGEGAQESLLRAEFPGLGFLKLRGYRVRYAKSGWGLVGAIFYQLPKILRSINKENQWLKEMIREHKFDAVISDNRYGLYDPVVRCVFITHQLRIKSLWGGWSERILQRNNYKYISRFASCWIPDEDNENGLAGELSHPSKRPAIPLHYAGLLSRFENESVALKKDHIVILLSGPEPQRSIFEEKIIKEIAHYNGTATIVRGLPGTVKLLPSTNMIRFFNHLDAADLNKEILQAEWVIGRCGYSTVMDIVKLQKKSILVPTPGQTEQLYLADYLKSKQVIYSVKQNDFSLEKSINEAKMFPYRFPAINEDLLRITVEQLLEKIQ